MCPLAVCLFLALPAVAAEPTRLGDDGFRVGERFGHAALSPDGKVFALAGASGRLYLLDAATGHLLGKGRSPTEVRDLVYGENGDLLAFGADDVVRRIDPAGRPRPGGCHVPVPRGSASEFHAGGRYVTALRQELWSGERTLFDAATGRAVPGVRFSDRAPFAFSPDGRWLVGWPGQPADERDPLKRQDGRTRLPADARLVAWDLRRGESFVVPTLPVAGHRANQIALDDAGRLLRIAEGELRETDLATGRARSTPLADWHAKEAVTRVCLSPDGRRVAALTWDRDAYRLSEWDRSTGRALLRRNLGQTSCNRLAYTSADRLVAWNEGGVRLDVCWGDGPDPVPASGHGHVLRDVRYTAAGRELESQDFDGLVFRWDVATGRVLDRSRRAEPPKESPTALAINGHWHFFARDDSTTLLDPMTARRWTLPPLAELLPRRPGTELAVIAEADGPFVAVLETAGREVTPDAVHVALVNTRVPKRVAAWSLPGDYHRWPSAVAPDGSRLTLWLGHGVGIFDARTGRLERVLDAARYGYLNPHAFSPDGRLLLCQECYAPNDLRLIEVATGTDRRRWAWEGRGVPWCRPAFRPDGRQIAYPLSDGTILLLPTDPDATPPGGDLWGDLAARDAAVAGAAVRAVAARPDALAEVRARLGEVVAPEPTELIALLSELDHDDPDRRDAARDKLRAVPAEALAAWRSALVQPSAEMLRALDQLLDEKAHLAEPTPDELRRLRLAEALERAGRPRP